jgi:hypothetical protein
MANMIRTAKPASKWGIYELTAFNIKIKQVNAETFFGNANLPQPTVSSAILDNLDEPPPPLSKADMDFFAYMEDAMAVPPDRESFVADFAAFILKLMRYDEGRRVIHSGVEIQFEMCGESVDAKIDVCVMRGLGNRGPKYLMLVQENKVRKHTVQCA